MKLISRILAPVAIALALGLGLAACAPAAEPVTVSANTVVVDVRTPAEFSAGHLKGAINIDVQSPTFDKTVATLPTDGDYVIYCHSGSRAATAITRLKALGFTTMVNAGGLEAAQTATGLPIIR
jgi:phage shock protein E